MSTLVNFQVISVKNKYSVNGIKCPIFKLDCGAYEQVKYNLRLNSDRYQKLYITTILY